MLWPERLSARRIGVATDGMKWGLDALFLDTGGFLPDRRDRRMRRSDTAALAAEAGT
ncbi:MAG: hypothetical protein JWO25_3242, partial [Alphaproteobacteria bacterium]|nr:hypothetical protein [Alphaproteobacteria bacterium]